MRFVHPLIALAVASAFGTFATFAGAEVGSAAGTACESQRLPSMPGGLSSDAGPNVVKVRALVRDGQVREVEFIKGSRRYASVIHDAMNQYRCRVQDEPFWVTQEFVFDRRGD